MNYSFIKPRSISDTVNVAGGNISPLPNTKKGRKEMATVKTYNKGEYELLAPDDLQTITQLATDSLKKHHGTPVKYENSPQGLNLFMEKSIDFFDYVNSINESIEPEKRLIPDIEAWCLYLGISRPTLLDYSRRNDTWKDAVEQVKTAIMAAKKQLALRYKIPPLVFVFDSTNNHGYVNSNEFKLSAEPIETRPQPQLSIDELDALSNAQEPPQIPEGDCP